jgi:HlyD family secretion protein
MSLLCSLPLAAQLFSACGPGAPLAVGYVEGDYALLAPIEVAEVKTQIAVAQAKAALAQAEAQLADLQVGKRPEEIAVLEASLRSAKAQAADAARTLARTQDLLKRGVATQAQYDDAATQAEVADAAIGQATANLAVGRLPARPETIKAAENQVKQAQTGLEQAEWRLSKRTLQAPAVSPG